MNDIESLIGKLSVLSADLELSGKEAAADLIDRAIAALRQQQGEPVPSYENIADMLPSILATGTEKCPLCGKTGIHQHSPEEIIIYRNGCKYGRSLFTHPPAPRELSDCMVMVPVEPTEKLLDAMDEAYGRGDEPDLREMYCALIAAVKEPK